MIDDRSRDRLRLASGQEGVEVVFDGNPAGQRHLDVLQRLQETTLMIEVFEVEAVAQGVKELVTGFRWDEVETVDPQAVEVGDDRHGRFAQCVLALRLGVAHVPNAVVNSSKTSITTRL